MKSLLCFAAVLGMIIMGAMPLWSQTPPDQILLKNYRPQSIYKIPVTRVEKARYPVIDVHSHAYAESREQIDQWVKNMDAAGIEKTVILTGLTGAAFDSVYREYARYPQRFEVWCGLLLDNPDQPDFGKRCMAELERCKKTGAMGVGELSDKGKGLSYGHTRSYSVHFDDPRLDPVMERCADLGMPINIHVGDPMWMYQPMDSTNDGLMNAYEWRLDNQPDIIDLNGLLLSLERMVLRHPRTTFIACHFANCDWNLARVGGMLERCPNLYADISARYAETAPIPRFASQFYAKYAGRLLYGTDMGFDLSMYRITFRILESLDEHFYETGQFGYHWALNGFGLPDPVLKQLYRENALRAFKLARQK
jgi:uncharacterized protein